MKSELCCPADVPALSVFRDALKLLGQRDEGRPAPAPLTVSAPAVAPLSSGRPSFPPVSVPGKPGAPVSS